MSILQVSFPEEMKDLARSGCTKGSAGVHRLGRNQPIGGVTVASIYFWPQNAQNVGNRTKPHACWLLRVDPGTLVIQDTHQIVGWTPSYINVLRPGLDKLGQEARFVLIHEGRLVGFCMILHDFALRVPQQQQSTNNNCSPVILFLCLYKGVETKSAAPSLFFDPPKQPVNMYFYQSW